MLYTESEAVTAVWNNLLFELGPLPLPDLSTGILITGSTEILDEEEEDRDGPGSSCLRGALAEMIMLYVIRAIEKVTSRVKKVFPQPIFFLSNSTPSVALVLFVTLCNCLYCIYSLYRNAGKGR